MACAQNDSAQEEACVEDLIRRNVSGVIVVSPNTASIKSHFYETMSRRVPLVFINSYQHIAGASYITTDERTGAKTALDHLFSYGHEKILFLRGEKSDSYRIKEEVYCQEMQKRDLFLAENILNIGAGNSLATVDNTMYQLMDAMLDIKATAIFACNDLMALGALNACQRMEKSVPKDISIIGFDNIALSHLAAPKLTTVDQHMQELGKTAARLMLDKINHSSVSDLLLPTTLVERETTGHRK